MSILEEREVGLTSITAPPAWSSIDSGVSIAWCHHNPSARRSEFVASLQFPQTDPEVLPGRSHGGRKGSPRWYRTQGGVQGRMRHPPRPLHAGSTLLPFKPIPPRFDDLAVLPTLPWSQALCRHWIGTICRITSTQRPRQHPMRLDGGIKTPRRRRFPPRLRPRSQATATHLGRPHNRR